MRAKRNIRSAPQEAFRCKGRTTGESAGSEAFATTRAGFVTGTDLAQLRVESHPLDPEPGRLQRGFDARPAETAANESRLSGHLLLLPARSMRVRSASTAQNKKPFSQRAAVPPDSVQIL